MNKWIYTAVIGFALYEFVEHIVLPIFWVIKNRKRDVQSGPFTMIGQLCRVVTWEGRRGKVAIKGELWNAECETPLIPGSEAVILKLQGLTLFVSPFDMTSKETG